MTIVKQQKNKSGRTRQDARKKKISETAASSHARTASKRTPRSPLFPGNARLNVGVFLVLILATVILYSGDLHLGFFAVDDPDYVTKNPWIKEISGANIGHILSTPYFANYSPVHLFSYMFDYGVAGESAYAFHLSSNIWAGIVAGFVFLTALALTQNHIVSIAAAILFMTHPVHVEAVAWISSRKDLVATAFALPSFLAYLKYRKSKARQWYIASVFLFLLAVAGKLSVATFPAVFLAYDLFIEKRPPARAIVDKIPFLLAALVIALIAASAQPSMGHRPDPYVLSVALTQNFWLLSGFATYVLYRMPPESTGMIWQLGAIIFLIGIFIAPFLLRKKIPMAAMLIYWIIFGFIPAQVLSFTHPVTDRYIFFPSVAAVIGIAWLFYLLANKLRRYGLAVYSTLMIIIAVAWAVHTLNYLSEWKDPRSVWFAASKKSNDPVITQNLGTYYVNIARGLTTSPQAETAKEDQIKLANVVWEKDPRLAQLHSEFSSGMSGGPVQKQFKDTILSFAWQAFEIAIRNKGDRVMTALYYNRGLILLEENKLDEAKKEFLAGINEASKETFAQARYEVSVYCYYSLGSIALKQNNYPEALKWFQLAKNQQDAAGINWMPTIDKTIKQLQNAIRIQPAQ